MAIFTFFAFMAMDSGGSKGKGKGLSVHIGPLDLDIPGVLLVQNQVAVFNETECWLSYKFRKQWGFKGLAGYGPPSKIERAAQMAEALIRENLANQKQYENEDDGDDWTVHAKCMEAPPRSPCSDRSQTLVATRQSYRVFPPSFPLPTSPREHLRPNKSTCGRNRNTCHQNRMHMKQKESTCG